MLLHQLLVILFQLMALVTFYLLHAVNDVRRMRNGGGVQKSKWEKFSQPARKL